jgi:hypothetical protein
MDGSEETGTHFVIAREKRAQPVNSESYHPGEPSIALLTDDSSRVMPTISRECNRILHVGYGGGQTLIASQLGPHVVAIGVDKDYVALKLGKQLTPSIHFVCSDGEQLPFEEDCFDLVMSRVSLPYMHIPKASIVLDSPTDWPSTLQESSSGSHLVGADVNRSRPAKR